MKTRRLGRTELLVSEIGLGGALLSRHGGPYARARDAVKRALDLGINYIDTAPGYDDSEEVVGRALQDEPRSVILSTKLGGRPQPFDAKDPRILRASVEESLRLLGRDQIDILLIHEPDVTDFYDWWDDPDAFDGPVMDFLDRIRDEGLARFIGLGGTTTTRLAQAVDTGRFDVVITAYNYSVLWREARDTVFAAALRHDVGVVVGSPLQGGALARRYDHAAEHGADGLHPARREQFRRLYRLLDETGLALPELALRFVLTQPTVACALMGARTAPEVEQNVAAAAQGPLPGDIMARLDEIAALLPSRPPGESTGFTLDAS